MTHHRPTLRGPPFKWTSSELSALNNAVKCLQWKKCTIQVTYLEINLKYFFCKYFWLATQSTQSTHTMYICMFARVVYVFIEFSSIFIKRLSAVRVLIFLNTEYAALHTWGRRKAFYLINRIEYHIHVAF